MTLVGVGAGAAVAAPAVLALDRHQHQDGSQRRVRSETRMGIIAALGSLVGTCALLNASGIFDRPGTVVGPRAALIGGALLGAGAVAGILGLRFADAAHYADGRR